MPAPPPPPPPPPPMPGAAGGPPPPPPPPPPANLPARPDAKQAKGRGALLGDIQSGAKLKKVGVVNDRSAPILDSKSSNSAAPPVGGAPPVPGLRTPTAPAANRARSNSDQGSIGAGANTASVTDSAPQLGGILAGGIPKLKKTGGGINIYDSDPETNNTRKSPPPTAPAASSNGPSLLRPSAPGAAPPLPPGAPPSVASLKDNLRPTIPSASTSAIPAQSTLNKPKPPPPIGKKPPIPPPSSRKPSSTATMPQSTPPPAPPLPPPSTSPAPPSAPPPPPLPTSSAPKLPPAPPQLPNGGIQRETSLAEQAARNAFRGSSPAAAPPPPPPPPPGSLSRNSSSQSPPESPSGAPPPPPPSAPPSRPVTAPAPPPPPPSAAPRQPSISSTQQEQSSLPPPPPPPPPAAAKSASTTAVPTAGGLPIGSSAPQLPPLSSMGAASYTLTNGNSGLDDGRPGSRSASGRGGPGGGPAIWMEDSKFKFQRDDQLPKPRPFEGVVKRYRAGRGSSVPLDLGAYM